MNKKLLILLLLFFNFYLSQAQCFYTGTPLISVGICALSSCMGTPIISSNVRQGQYALGNVLLGSTYRFSLGNLFSNNENSTILNTKTTHTTGAFLLDVSNKVVGTGGTKTSGATNTYNPFFL